jgi:cysteine desulfurase/selenocysteine lyase
MTESGTEQLIAAIDVNAIRGDFPILHQQVNGKPLIYFDNAATSQTPIQVIQAIHDYYTGDNANIHRGIHTLAERATAAFESTRKAVQAFINAREEEEIIFTYGTTDGINLVSSSYGRAMLSEGDEIIISGMEHHSNIVPWQMLCEETGAKLIVVPVTDDGEFDMGAYKALIGDRTKVVSVVHISNALGTVNPVEEITAIAHEYGAVVLIDGAQAAPHMPIDVQKINCDFYCFSAHKMFGPTGVGILYGKRRILEAMPPFRGGGEMIKEVSFEGTTFNDIPYKFEAGTPNIADVVALKAAVDYLNDHNRSALWQYEVGLLEYATRRIEEIPEVTIVGSASHKSGVLSFLVAGMHHYDVGLMMDARGIAVRTGHHCTQPLMHRFEIEGTVRASFSIYNTREEIDYFIQSLKEIIQKWK